jgi:hypothetical protein
MATGKGLRLGIALSDGVVVGVVQGRKGAPTASIPLHLPTDGADAGPELVRALGELKSKLERAGVGPTSGAQVQVTLLPPLADARLIPFPPLRRAEVEAVLSRDVSRYFLGPSRPRVVGVRVPDGNGKPKGQGEGAAVPILAAAAPLAVLEAVSTALSEVGWQCRSCSAAHAGWLRAAGASKGTPFRALIAVTADTAHVLRLEGRNPVGIRQLPVEDLTGLLEAVGSAKGRALVLGDPRLTEPVHTLLAGKGWTVSGDPEGWAGAEETAAARAAPGLLELAPPAMVAEKEARARRNAAFLAAAAVVLVLGAAGAHLWGAYRELGAVRDQREAIRAEVGPLLDARDSLSQLRQQVETVQELGETAPLWTRSLVELAALLPPDTYLTGFFASGDTLELEAAGARAGETIQILREAGLFEDVRLQGIVEREMEGGETVVERFSLRARLPAREGAER